MQTIDHNQYFNALNLELKNYKRAIPFLLLDLDILDQNLAALKHSLNEPANFRVVVKSLPSPELIDYVMKGVGTKKLMVFHQPFLSDLSSRYGQQVDILLGKPMPVRTAEYYYRSLVTHHGFDPASQLQWLVDTPRRISEYLELAKSLSLNLRLNLEIDVGLHRGGFSDLSALASALNLIRGHPDQLTFSGFMGYDPHVVKMPRILISPQQAFQKANAFYQQCKALVKEQFPELWQDQLTFNGAGSPTLEWHSQQNSPLNDIAAGSCFVKPTTFDIPTLEKYQPACFIATPVLKKFKNTTLPAIEKFKGLLNTANTHYKNSWFIYGGYWKANYCYPVGIKENALFGPSTNQVMLNAPPATQLEVDDFVFLRPWQSEFVMLQFGNILTLRNGKVSEEWTLLKG